MLENMNKFKIVFLPKNTPYLLNLIYSSNQY